MAPNEQTAKKPSRIQLRNRSKILEAALDVFSTHGYRGSTLDQIAEAAGLSKPNILYYFDGKEEIFVTLLGSLVDQWIEPLRQIDPDGEPLEEIRRYVARKVQMSKDMERESRLFANEILQGAPRIGEHLSGDLQELFTRTTGILTAWMDQGKIAQVDPEHLLYSIWATTQHYADFRSQIDMLSGHGKIDSADAFLDQLYVKLLTP
ncbi:TetR family transcriptional regulator C-terminal domain-containing protein [Cognatishimia activa]|uniref:TetR family transcriptional regulator C-terminal domain-containing protein n=1 Tax=Cognatishimia activa TaxID=1715691 RepID=A0A975ERH3_9RHOB|nr:TetR family transcriptional regulator C-terminal domain-containing protein [Cognatishimia activa]QTN36870.1 TetR family transcriptional regulator C-terminal domain-containing protein [Cognatishimia activa]